MLDRYDYGILGVGEIGAAIVTGLCQGADDPPRILDDQLQVPKEVRDE
jgi:hypothetical protein